MTLDQFKSLPIGATVYYFAPQEGSKEAKKVLGNKWTENSIRYAPDDIEIVAKYDDLRYLFAE